MDRPLDDTIAERQKSSFRGRRGARRNIPPRDGVRKSTRDDRTDLDRDWVHDRFDDDRNSSKAIRGNRRNDRNNRNDRNTPEPDDLFGPTTAKIRVDNLHYDLTEDDLQDLFERIAPVESLTLRYDRAGRSDGTAYVTYATVRNARRAIDEFDGANAKGQPIRLTLMPTAPGRNRDVVHRSNNPFDRVEKPSRSLFDRVEKPRSASPMSDEASDRRGAAGTRGRRGDTRRSDVTKPAPEGIDRYVPGESRRSPTRRRGDGVRERGRRPGEHKDGGRRGGRRGEDEDGHKVVNGRPRKTQEELDAEMADYWSAGQQNVGNGNVDAAAPQGVATTGGFNGTAPAATTADEDIDMIE